MKGADVHPERGTVHRVLVVDDHPLLRAMLCGILGEEAGVQVVGEASDGCEAVRQCARLDPDLVLMDVSMPRMDGLAATREIKGRNPETVVLMFSAHESTEYMLEAVLAGAAGYVTKDASPNRLLDAIRRALGGESPLNQEVAMRLLRRLCERPAVASGPQGNGLSGNGHRPTLTPREREVLAALAVGKTNRQIAAEFSISRATVKTHVERLIRKLGVSDRTQAAVKAVQLGFVVGGS